MPTDDEASEVALSPKAKVLVVGALVLAAIGCAFGAWASYSKVQRFRSTAARAEGVVVELETVSSTDGPDTYAPIVRFTAPGGAEITFTSELPEYPPPFRIGEVVPVLYAPGDPRHAETERALKLPLPSIVMAAFAGGFAFFGVVIARHEA